MWKWWSPCHLKRSFCFMTFGALVHFLKNDSYNTMSFFLVWNWEYSEGWICVYCMSLYFQEEVFMVVIIHFFKWNRGDRSFLLKQISLENSNLSNSNLLQNCASENNSWWRNFLCQLRISGNSEDTPSDGLSNSWNHHGLRMQSSSVSSSSMCKEARFWGSSVS